MSNSAITTQLAQLKVGNVQNQADSSSVYSAGVWSFKNSTALTSVTITDAGNVGVGVTPSAWSSIFKALHIGNGGGSLSATTLANDEQIQLCSNTYYDGTAYKYVVSAHASRYVQNNGMHDFYVAPSGIAGNSVTETQAMRIDSSGNVGIGTASPASTVVLDIKEPDAGQDLILGLTAGTGARAQIRSIAQGNATSSAMSFYTTTGNSSSERMRIEPSGNIKIGTNGLDPSSSVYGVQIGYPGNTYWVSSNTGTSGYAHMAFLNASGIVGSISTAGSGTVYNTSSDYRLKKDVKPISDALSKVSTLKPCTYKWKFDDSDGVGFIAHELAEVCPEAVTGEKDAVNEDGSINPQGIDPSKLVSILTAAIQELSAKVDAQAAEIEALKAKP